MDRRVSQDVAADVGADGVRRSVALSADGRYRYLLRQSWYGAPPERRRAVAFVMLNPSTADHQRDDPTLRRCRGFARAWGYNALEVVNLYAYRATNPRALGPLPAAERVGGEVADDYLGLVVGRCHLVVAAWGRRPARLPRAEHAERVRLVLARLARVGKPVRCLGLTQAGEPRHPLMLPKATPLELFLPEVA